jgi:acetylglutamate kinase
MMRGQNLPVISPVAYDAGSSGGGALNVNGDDAAAAIAAAIGAEELLLIADVDGVLNDQGTLIPLLTSESARELIESGTAANGMAAKLESANSALLSGVERVRICGLTGLVDGERGTFITQSQSVAI